MKKLLTLMLAFAMTLAASAQERQRPAGSRFNPEEAKAKTEAFITERAKLTAEEAKAIFPLFHEMKEKQREAMKPAWKQKKAEKPTDEKECAKALKTLLDCNEKQADIEEDYYEKMLKVAPASKVYAVKLADDALHREMLRKMQQHGQGQHRPQAGQGQRPRQGQHHGQDNGSRKGQGMQK